MTPTCRLRFVEREIGYSKTGNITDLHTVRILQQWWQAHVTGMTSTNGEEWVAASAGEWRDVPLEEEKA
jgi:uncharacterized protein YprB with RNaseH-like and TPR domain